MKTPEEIKDYLRSELPVHYHRGDIEPRLTPLKAHEIETVHAETLAYIRQLEAKAPQWISVKKRLPDIDSFLGISRFNNDVRVCRKRSWNKEFTVGGLDIKKDIVWWMPLPEPPKEEV